MGNCKELILNLLKNKKADGLIRFGTPICFCDLKNLVSCQCDFSECFPAYKIYDFNCEDCKDKCEDFIAFGKTEFCMKIYDVNFFEKRLREFLKECCSGIEIEISAKKIGEILLKNGWALVDDVSGIEKGYYHSITDGGVIKVLFYDENNFYESGDIVDREKIKIVRKLNGSD